jgi:hypothetical protein
MNKDRCPPGSTRTATLVPQQRLCRYGLRHSDDFIVGGGEDEYRRLDFRQPGEAAERRETVAG